MKGDFSRWAFNPTERYSSVRLQQGRVALDSEWNEQARIDDRLRRAALDDIIGGCCVPSSMPDSFRVSVANGQIRVAPGRIWVEGILCESDATQTLPLPQGPGRHLVYLEVFERHVTGVEDPQIIEVALGGPDTATRTKTIVRARVAPVGGDASCATLGDWAPPDRTTGQLTASTGAQPADTPCVVPAQAGYAGLENQLYRVEIQRSGTVGQQPPPTFKWSRDNGSVLSRWLDVDGDELVLPTPGVDDVLGFQDNRWVELGHDGLDATGAAGTLVEVIGRRTDSLGLFRLRFDAHGQAVPDPATLSHPKVRRWDQDQGSDPSLGGVPVPAAGVATSIEGGIEVRFSAGFYRSGDHWMIPARTFSGTSTGDILWPRDSNGVALAQPPHGVERFTCRLAVVSAGAGAAAPQVADCRSVFPSLCGLERSSGCCTVTVGRAGADVATITEALARLPEEGGEICVLPGEYVERVDLDGRHDISIHGCGGRTVVAGEGAGPVFSLDGARDIRISTIGVRNLGGPCVRLNRAEHVSLVDLRMTAGERSAVVGADVTDVSLLDSSIDLLPSEEPAKPQRRPGVFLGGDALRIEGNRILAGRERDLRSMAGGGIQVGGPSSDVVIRGNEIVGGAGPGIALGSVTTVSSRPDFGDLFRSFATRAIADPAAQPQGASFTAAVTHYRDVVREPGATVVRELPGAAGFLAVRPAGGRNLVSDGDLRDVLIAENEIRGMGSSGITVAHFFDLVEGEGDLIAVHGLEILGNLVEDCVAVPQEPVPAAMADDSALGGVTLAEVTGLVVRDNTIQGNGRATRTPCCGIYVLAARGVEIHRNVVRHNGRLPKAGTAATLDQRGGIVLVHATAPTVTLGAGATYAEGPGRELTDRPVIGRARLGSQVAARVGASTRRDGTPAVRIQDNVVIAPEGRALEIVALGSVVVQGNQFTALGSNYRDMPNANSFRLDLPEMPPSFAFMNALGGLAVWIMDLGVSIDGGFQHHGFAAAGTAVTTGPTVGDKVTSRSVLAGGNVQFTDNQVVLDGLDGTPAGGLSAVTLTTLDDLLIADNQCTCELANDNVAVNTLAYGWSARVTSNRFKETPKSVNYSAVSLGFMNTTTDNQGTHCFVRVAPTIPAVHQNTVLIEQMSGGGDACSPAAAMEKNLRSLIFGS